VDLTVVDLPKDPSPADELPTEPSESLLRLRVAVASRATLLREAHSRLQDDLSALRSKARS
jgi:hypothetical protein